MTLTVASRHWISTTREVPGLVCVEMCSDFDIYIIYTVAQLTVFFARWATFNILRCDQITIVSDRYLINGRCHRDNMFLMDTSAAFTLKLWLPIWQSSKLNTVLISSKRRKCAYPIDLFVHNPYKVKIKLNYLWIELIHWWVSSVSLKTKSVIERNSSGIAINRLCTWATIILQPVY